MTATDRHQFAVGTWEDGGVLRSVVVVAFAALCACAPPAPVHPRAVPPSAGELPPPPDAKPDALRVTWTRVATAADVPPPPPPGTFRLHLIDVGTGLALFVQGSDFAMLYDAGTNDRDEKPRRVAAYLAAALGPSGDEDCVDVGAAKPTTRRAIDHVVLSHPHLDHASALELVLHCYDVAHVWDSGRVHPTVFYRELLATVAKLPATYHTAASVPADHTVMVKDLAITIPNWQRFSEGDEVRLGERAKFMILHAEPKATGDPNENSVVLALVLGDKRVLLVGDAESGPRKDPTYPLGDVEEFLVDHHAADIRADILQVGHHGSITSSRRDFLEVVKPSLALVSSGPKTYGGKTLPDREVLDELARIGATILRTDERDGACPVSGRIGGDKGPGGCDTWVITIGP
ncbi:MAG TPA: MBL fold metallo-hydrolase [Kofleriaceae bacterium]|nr:MBL fold metallo-hydrolase [Kofleriaceae bacterium]